MKASDKIYIDAEKLKSEIERRIKSWTNREKYALPGQGKDTCTSCVTELTDLLSFIDSLQQEQPEVDLEKEMTAYIERHFHVRYDETLENGNDPLTTFDFCEIARHFYELGKSCIK